MKVGDIYMRMAARDRAEEEKRRLWNRAIREAATLVDGRWRIGLRLTNPSENILELIKPPKKQKIRRRY